MTAGSLVEQLWALLRRNYLLKRRKCATTLAEFLVPAALVIVITPYVRQPQQLPTQLRVSSQIQLCLFPDGEDIRNVSKLVRKNLKNPSDLRFLSSSLSSPNITQQIQTGECDVAILFDHNNIRHNGSYEIRILNGRTVNGFDFSYANKEQNDDILSSFKRAVDAALIQFWKPDLKLNVIKPLMSLFPAAGIEEELDPSDKQKTAILPFYVIAGYSSLISILCLNIVQEKERKIKETNVIMGLSIPAYWISWFLIEFIILVIAASLQILALITFDVLPNVSIKWVFFTIILYGCSSIFMAFMLTPFFKSSKTAASVSSTVLILISLLYLLAVYAPEIMSRPLYFLMSFFSPCAFTLAIQKITEFNIRGGFNSDDLFEGEFSVAHAMIMLVVDTVIYGLFTYILDNALSEETLDFCGFQFPWSRRKTSIARANNGSSVLEVHEGEQDIELRESTSKESIRLSSIKKVYNAGKTRETKAIDGLTLDIYKGEITALLGHNGAGKTTLIKLLTGNLRATSGELAIGKDDIRENDYLHYMRQECGVCPQENILFDTLSAYEHLQFYGGMKGLSIQEYGSTMRYIKKSLELTEFMDKPTKEISGAEKRKVCLAIALISMPKFLFLDEPTSGLDPDARRKVWSVLRNLASENKTIILTTHDMEEADILADRKAVISKGKLRCVGSSMYLKMKFGIGYHLAMTITPSCDVSAVMSRIHQHSPHAESSRPSVSEMKVVLPFLATSQLTSLLLDLENYASNLGVLNYGISLPTLEEVFTKLEDEIEENGEGGPQDDEAHEEIPLQEDVIDNSNMFLTKRSPSFGLRFLAFLKIRFLLKYRYPSHVFGLISGPLIYVIVAKILVEFIANSKGIRDNEISLDTRLYDRKMATIQNNTGYDVETVVRTLRSRGFDIINKVENFDESNFLIEINILTYDIYSTTASIQWTWTFYPFHRYTQLVTLNLMSNVVWGSINYRNENKHLSTNLREVVKIQNIDALIALMETITTVSCVALSLVHVATLNAVEALCDKEENVKNQLYISGLSGFAYWFPILLIHTIFFILLIILEILLLIGVQMPYFYGDVQAQVIFWAVVFLNIPAELLYVYIFTYLFKSHSTAYALLPAIFVWLTVFFTIFGYRDMGPAFYFIMFVLCPFFTPVRIGISLAKGFGNQDEYMSSAAVALAAIIVGTLLYGAILKFVDTFSCEDIFRFFSSPLEQQSMDFPEEDDDVKKEKEAVALVSDSVGNQMEVLRIKNVTKVYAPQCNCCCKKKQKLKIAVKGLSFSVKKGEIFGFLGAIGAGKTSTVKIITGEEKATSGKVFIGNKEVTRMTADKVGDIGYCPQQDALWKRLTLEEHLKFYSTLKGIPSDQLSMFCERAMDLLNITEHRSKLVKDLSGGTKRKLCSLLSTFSHPKLLLLDEPSSGIDPVSKRKLWEYIRSHFQQDSPNAALITTHSMEEAEAICTRIGIMVNGILRCLGSVQHLKNKYGEGYVLQFRLPIDMLESDKCNLKNKLQEFVDATFPKAKFKASSGVWLSYNVPKEAVFSIADAFQALETAKRELQFLDYTFSQSTLEQVFLELTKEQEGVHLSC